MLKRVFDIFLSGTGLTVSLPLWGLIALAINMEDGGPVFYRQRRVGKDVREFDALKFRSMRVDAEKETGAVWDVFSARRPWMSYRSCGISCAET